MRSLLKRVVHFPVIHETVLPFLTITRWISAHLSSRPYQYRLWNERCFQSESAFWDQWFVTRGLTWPDDYCARLDPDNPLLEDIGQLITCDNPKILDVGAGPLTVLGKIWNGKRLDITAIDPMGAEYAAILHKHNIVPLVPTMTGSAEELTKYFAPNTFDFCFAQNCLDHGYDPAKSVEQMVEIAKPRGVILLRHAVNEGKNELYRALHQWNFYEKNGDLMVSTPGIKPINITARLSKRASVNISYDPWMRVVIRKGD